MSGEHSLRQQSPGKKRDHDQIVEPVSGSLWFSPPTRCQKRFKDSGLSLDSAFDREGGVEMVFGNELQIFEDDTIDDIPEREITNVFVGN
ncbi:hypothetical protein AC578_1294 [Pseudocercospora eumusae]|uniref:Uncharacterized protein n=1 Tax=Pseudocercospora eumusae TaxID=321146 RepID=A0A139HUM0_9PEZI|nr:hypothetical protein AC578_1294 [Pseudocercospora eumusae]